MNKIFLLILLLFSECIYAASMGRVSFVRGDVQIRSKEFDRFIKARVGMTIFEGDTLKTGKRGICRITLMEKSVLTFGPSSFSVINKSWSGKEIGVIKLLHGMIKGRVDSKKSRKDKLRVKTQSYSFGVRGTQFEVGVPEGREEMHLGVVSGVIQVNSGGKKFNVNSNEIISLNANRVKKSQRDLSDFHIVDDQIYYHVRKGYYDKYVPDTAIHNAEVATQGSINNSYLSHQP